jgi:NTE family protein
MKKCAIVFSGGGLRGFFQFGSLSIIEEYIKKNNYKLETVVGTSFGSISASLTALGLSSEEIINYSEKNFNNFKKLAKINFNSQSLLKNDFIPKKLKEYIGRKKFSNLEHELIINAVDVIDGKEYMFSKNGIYDSEKKNYILKSDIQIIHAIMSSTAVPGIFPPKRIGDKVFIDGGVISPLCLHAIDIKKYDLVFAIDTCMANFNFINPEKIKRFDLIKQAISIMQNQGYKNEISKYKHEFKNIIFINADFDPKKVLKKGEVKYLIDYGASSTKKAINKHHKQLENLNKTG